MESISLYLTNKMLENKIISPQKFDIYRKGMCLLVSDVINFALIILLGLLFHSLIYGLLYILMLVYVRRFCGGFHAKRYWVCRTATIGTFLAVLAMGTLIKHWLAFAVVSNLAALATMIVFAPIRHPNRKLTPNEVKGNKLLSTASSLLCSAISITLILLHIKAGLIISLNLSAITVLMYIGMIVNSRMEV